jgi:phosphoglycerate dehydrogenase-like enzyme
MTKILLAWQDAPRSLPQIRAALPADCEFLVPRPSPEYGPWEADPDEVIRLARDVDIIMGWDVPREALLGATRLKHLSSPHAGMDLFDFKLFREKGISLSNARGVNAVAVAEHAIALLFALAKRIPAHDAAVKRTDWVQWSPETASAGVTGKVAAVLGLGQVGNEIAKRCRGLEMTVIAVRRTPSAEKGYADEVRGPEALHDVLRRSDFVILAVPLTKTTRGMIGVAELQAMKPSAFLINIGRGMLVKEAALHEALVKGGIAGFAADVWFDYSGRSPAGYHYDVPSRFGIHRLPNVIGTANVAANVAGMRDRMIAMGVENINQFLSGQVPDREVNLEAGY